MSPSKIIPELRTCPVDGTVFEVGGRGRPPRKAIYCSRHCMGVATYSHLPVEKGSSAPRPRKNHDTLHNEVWLRQKYLGEDLNASEIARLLGCSPPAVAWALDKFGIAHKSMADGKRGRPSTTVWTPEMREKLAVRFRGEGGTNYGKPSGHRGPNFHPDPKVSAVQKQRAYRRGITAPEYDAMLAAQGGVCAICGRPELRRHRAGTPFTMGVDHDHKTGKIRGLLCTSCNTGLGMAQDSPVILQAMIAYLESHQVT